MLLCFILNMPHFKRWGIFATNFSVINNLILLQQYADSLKSPNNQTEEQWLDESGCSIPHNSFAHSYNLSWLFE
jgi:5-formaminoimidazole-4-carboxamide-1-beta-D-ribofuranosyl 5'-monophosphate synthetase